MDGGTIAAFLAGLAALTTAVGGVIVQLRRTDPTNVKVLQDRLRAVEEDNEKLREQNLGLVGEVHRLKMLAAAHGWLPPAETEEVLP